MPEHEDVNEDLQDDVRRDDGGGMTVDLGDLTDRKQTKKGGAEREGEDEESGLELADDREQVRDERREERQNRRQKKDAERERDRLARELAAANTRLAEVEARQARGEQLDVAKEVERLEGEMTRLQGAYREALVLKEKAFRDRENPESARNIVQADEVLQSSREQFARLEAQRLRLIDSAQRAAAAPRVSATLKSEAEAFMEEHPWYNQRGGDADSRAVLREDRRLAAEGELDPNTPEYWDELRERVRAALPHRFEDDRQPPARERERTDDREERQTRRRPITRGGGRESADVGGGRNSYHLSALRVAALKEAGLYDLDESGRPGPKLSKMIRRYKAADEAEARRRRG